MLVLGCVPRSDSFGVLWVCWLWGGCLFVGLFGVWFGFVGCVCFWVWFFLCVGCCWWIVWLWVCFCVVLLGVVGLCVLLWVVLLLFGVCFVFFWVCFCVLVLCVCFSLGGPGVVWFLKVGCEPSCCAVGGGRICVFLCYLVCWVLVSLGDFLWVYDVVLCGVFCCGWDGFLVVD